MGKLHVILCKEDLNKEKLNENKLVVVFDILMATSVITSVLKNGAKEVLPVLNGEAALLEAESREKESYLLVGEYQGLTIEGFHSPHPQELKGVVKEKTVILSTTNGTVAIRNAIEAKQVFVASLLNAAFSAKQVLEQHTDETIVLVCSGSSGSFNLEDFYGVGYYIECLLRQSDHSWELTDSALAAHQFFKGAADRGEELLKASRVGRMLSKYGMDDEVAFVASRDIYNISPVVKENGMVVIDK
ncbi:2-phosphosulfolactate phosphatase [Cytobacillus purgationiresistens]|uniref:Probable 2-phosphosulfolactate phosphatase n=1 Tax=Cytobacillus purgationiresistens TaxID=863449 RepID=A0ABU0AFH7_9BACI|nr:2-phosphosulfolactate phosphatase [Cytobacillus purgationiresistens]MDQ0269775.1 2-phosphosulfolactate phosphatase [Cytobacillus purgationiresistens]